MENSTISLIEDLDKRLQDLAKWKEQSLPYLVDLEKLMTLMGNHTYASGLQLLIKR